MTGFLSSNRPNTRQYRPLLHLAGPTIAVVVLLCPSTPVAHSLGGWSQTAPLLSPSDSSTIPRVLVICAYIIPIAVYAYSMRTAYDVATLVSLRAKVCPSINLRAWDFMGIARLLGERESFMDNASDANSTLRVYDVQWGSVFPCYNSGVASSVKENAFRRARVPLVISEDNLNEWILANKTDLGKNFQHDPLDDLESPPAIRSDVYSGETVENVVQRKKEYGRRQYLDIVYVSREGKRPRVINSALDQLQRLTTSQWPFLLLSSGAVLVLTKYQCIGTSALVLIRAVARFLALRINVKRPPLYLRNREVHSGCMLVAAHENATTWTLYIGDRGTIDTLLNKPMVEIGEPSSIVLTWFRAAELSIPIAMVYAIMQGGWDVVSLLAVTALLEGLDYLNSRDRVVSAWLREEGLATKAFRCQFPGRSELIGAVQLLSRRKTSIWMDGILAPVPRRDAWLQVVGAVPSDPDSLQQSLASLDAHDRNWIKATGLQTMAAHELISERLKEMADL